jgi:hypothetical protein
MSKSTKTRVQRIERYLGIIFFVLLMFITIDFTSTSARPVNNCGDICSDGANRPCTYIVGEGMCYGVGIWE